MCLHGWMDLRAIPRILPPRSGPRERERERERDRETERERERGGEGVKGTNQTLCAL